MLPTRIFCAIVLSGLSLASAASAAQLQPFLLICVRGPDSPYFLAGTVSADTEFDSLGRSHDFSDAISLHAKLLERTSKGFRISWTVSQRVRGIETTHFSEDIIVPWDEKKTLKSIPGWIVEAFYSDRPANERRDLVPNHAMKPTARFTGSR